MIRKLDSMSRKTAMAGRLVKLNEIHALFKYLHSVFLWTGFFEFLIYRLFLPGPENESDLNYTPQSTFRIYPKGFVPSHPGGGGVECTVQMRDRFIYFLGEPVLSKIYDFLENLQTAFDPPPRPFFGNFIAFFPKVHDQNFRFSSASAILINTFAIWPPGKSKSCWILRPWHQKQLSCPSCQSSLKEAYF